jgi:adenylyltransferase/sulfurtransferase
MDTQHVFNRFQRQISLSEVGWEGQLKLSHAKVIVIGAGGLGCPVLQYLVSCGVGTIQIIDSDQVELSNLHRQILYTASDIGQSKAPCAQNKLVAINENCHISSCTIRLNSENALNLLADYDVIVDATDNFSTRYVINDAAEKLGIPVVFGAIQGFQGQVSIFNYTNESTYRKLFPDEGKYKNVSCQDNGILGIIPAIIGSFMANEVLKLLLHFPVEQLLVNHLLVYDFKDHSQSLIKL